MDEDIQAGLDSGELIFTDEGVLSAEDVAARRAAGIDVAEVTEEEIAEQALREQEADVFDAPLQTGFERAIGAATFGLSDLARGSESAYEARRRVEFNPTAAVIGEIAGSVAPALVSGGTGTVGTLARLTPAGRLSAATGRLAARGGLSRAMAGGAIEGIAQAGGDYVARVSLDENAEFSGEALASALLSGGVLGAGAGAAGRGIERALGAGARRLAAPARDALGEATEETAGLAPLLAAKKPPKWSSYKRVVRRKLAASDAASARALGEALDSSATRNVAREVDDIVSSASMAAAREADDSILVLEDATRRAATEFAAAADDARGWFQRFGQAADLPNAKVKITRPVDDALADEGADAIARLDEARFALDDHIAELRARAGLPVAQGADALPEAIAASSKTLRERAGDLVGGIRRPTEAVLGAAELARDAGIETPIPTVRDIPVIGTVMGAYLRYKGIKAAARGLGGRIPRSPATNAAERVVSSSDRIRAKVRNLAAGTLGKVAGSRAPSIATKIAAEQVRQLLATDLATASAAIHQDLAETTSAVQVQTAAAAERALGYLARHAPADPMPQRLPGQREWEPTPVQAAEWQRRVAAVIDPIRALDRVMTSAGAALELQVLREVHPSHWAEAARMFESEMAALQQRLPAAQYHALGRAFNVATSAAQMPGYSRAPGIPPQPVAPTPQLPGPGVSRAADLEEVET